MSHNWTNNYGDHNWNTSRFSFWRFSLQFSLILDSRFSILDSRFWFSILVFDSRFDSRFSLDSRSILARLTPVHIFDSRSILTILVRFTPVARSILIRFSWFSFDWPLSHSILVWFSFRFSFSILDSRFSILDSRFRFSFWSSILVFRFSILARFSFD